MIIVIIAISNIFHRNVCVYLYMPYLDGLLIYKPSIVWYDMTRMFVLDTGPLLDDISTKFHSFVAGNRTIKFNMYSGVGI